MVGTSVAFSKCSVLSGPGFKRAFNEPRWVKVPRAGTTMGLDPPSLSLSSGGASYSYIAAPTIWEALWVLEISERQQLEAGETRP